MPQLDSEDSGPSLNATPDFSATLFAYPARASGLHDEPGLLEIARSRAIDTKVFDEHPPFFWAARISSMDLDSYFTRMMPSTLRNFALDATAGVSFQDSHNWRELPLGQSLLGEYKGPAGNVRDPVKSKATVSAAFYTIPGMRLGRTSTDDFHLGMRAGIVRDVSVGFSSGSMVCSICKGNMESWDCPHYPGASYFPLDENGKPNDRGEPMMAEGWYEDCHLNEVSAVFDGANPSAAILKALRAVEEGRISRDQVEILETRYRVRLRHPPTISGGGISPSMTLTLSKLAHGTTVTEESMDDEIVAAPAERTPATTESAPIAETRAAELLLADATLDTVGAPAGMLEERIAWLVAERDSRQATIAGLEPLAAEGRTYRSHLIDEAIQAGVTATGASFAEATYRDLLATAPLDTIKRMRDDWKARSPFAAGRATIEDSGRENHAAPAFSVPDAAYRAR